MILPTKHIKTKDSLLGRGAQILELIHRPQTVSNLWAKAKKNQAFPTFESFVITLDFLYTLNAIDFKQGLVGRAIERC
jgi:hypothetical protein